MDPLLAKTLIDTLADDHPLPRRSSRPHRHPVPARLRAAATMRRWADRVEPRTADPAPCTA